MIMNDKLSTTFIFVSSILLAVIVLLLIGIYFNTKCLCQPQVEITQAVETESVTATVDPTMTPTPTLTPTPEVTEIVEPTPTETSEPIPTETVIFIPTATLRPTSIPTQAPTPVPTTPVPEPTDKVNCNNGIGNGDEGCDPQDTNPGSTPGGNNDPD